MLWFMGSQRVGHEEQPREIRKPSSAINAKKEENNRMGKTRDLFKKSRDFKGTCYAKMGKIKTKMVWT